MQLKEELCRLTNNDLTLTQLNLGNDPVTLVLTSLVNNKIGDLGVKNLGSVLEKNTTLTQLNLICNQIGPMGAKDLAFALEKNTTLTQLDLGYNEVGDVGVKYFCSALEKNTTLTQLDLECNKIGPVGAKDLASTLGKNTTLTQLYLGGYPIVVMKMEFHNWDNEIGDVGVKDFCSALVKNTTLTKLDLANNRIGDLGVKDLGSALEKNTTLTQLNFSYFFNEDTAEDKDEGKERIKLLLGRNKKIADKVKQSYEDVKQSAKALRMVSQYKSGFFSRLPREVNIKIASLTGDGSVHSEEKLLEIATHYFK